MKKTTPFTPIQAVGAVILIIMGFPIVCTGISRAYYLGLEQALNLFGVDSTSASPLLAAIAVMVGLITTFLVLMLFLYQMSKVSR